ncbi:MAG: 30S ribosomal protein S2 [Nitrospinae bacterium]|nr:30S ribosomal protein S2 [Nitrospinota bacterium]
MQAVTIKEMMEAGVHFGHQTKRWNPKMKKFIFGSRNGIYIFDLQKSSKLFNKALEKVKEIGANGGTILFVATKPQARAIVVEEAGRCGMPFVVERWLGGMLTNFETVRKSVARLKELDGMADDGTFEVLSKKEVIQLQKEREKLHKNLNGIRNMEKLPDAMFIIDTKNERIALTEALRLHIPVVGIVDTNCDPEGIEYIIPGNDDAIRSIRLISSSVASAFNEGKEEYAMKQKAVSEERERAQAAKRAEEQARREAQVKEAEAKAAEGGDAAAQA